MARRPVAALIAGLLAMTLAAAGAAAEPADAPVAQIEPTAEVEAELGRTFGYGVIDGRVLFVGAEERLAGTIAVLDRTPDGSWEQTGTIATDIPDWRVSGFSVASDDRVLVGVCGAAPPPNLCRSSTRLEVMRLDPDGEFRSEGLLDPAGDSATSIGLSGTTLAVGNLSSAGNSKVFVHRLNPSTGAWEITQELRSPDPGRGEGRSKVNPQYARTLALDGETLAVGAPNRSNVYIYRDTGGPEGFVLTQRIASPDLGGNGFGEPLLLDGNRLVATAASAWVLDRDGPDEPFEPTVVLNRENTGFGFDVVHLDGDVLVGVAVELDPETPRRLTVAELDKDLRWRLTGFDNTAELTEFRIDGSLAMVATAEGTTNIVNLELPDRCLGWLPTRAGNGNVFGTAGRDVIIGSEGPDRILGLDGDDVICGGAGDDIIGGGPGDDLLDGGPGADLFRGGFGNDTVDYSNSPAAVTARLDGIANDGVTGEADNIETGVENITGSPFDDLLIGDRAANTLTGGDGNDRLIGAAGPDTLNGGAGNDLCRGSSGQDTYLTCETTQP